MCDRVAENEYVETLIEKEMQSSYLDYAMSVIIGRALPDARDGLKPAQRRTLYAMYKLGNTHDKPTKKSARIVGSVIGLYHPHGDLAAYATLVRMAQPFSMNHTLVEGQGNMGCFTADTKIRLVDGRDVSFSELIDEQAKGKRHWTYSINPDTHLIEIAEIKNPRQTRKNATLVEVTLDNGEKIKCTPDHRFLTRYGIYKQAKDLAPEDSLIPLYTKIYDGADDKNLKGYEVLLQPYNNNWQFTHRLSDAWNIREGVYAKSRGKIRHHIDFNKKNNNPDNITRLNWKEHWEVHYNATAWRHKHDPEYVRKLAEGRRKFIEENPTIFSKRLSERNKRNWKDPAYRKRMTEMFKALWDDDAYKEGRRKLSSTHLKNLWKTKEFQELMSGLASERLKELWKDPAYRERQRKRTKEISDRLWSNPEHRKYISESMKRIAKDPTWIARQSKIAKALWNDPIYRGKFSTDRFKEMSKKLWADEAFRGKMRMKAIEQWKDPYFRGKMSSLTRERGLKRSKENPQLMKALAQLSKQSLHKKWRDPQYKQRVIKSKILGHTSKLLKKYKIITPEIYDSERKNNGVPRATNALKYFSDFEQIVQEARTYNHKVVSVQLLNERADVFDITIEKLNNFALSAGVFVHNSIDGDPPAAQRYTEVRLNSLAEEMLADIEKKSVPFIPNFDNTEEEPLILPSKVPNLLLNGAAGIAVGVATNILPHNLREICDAIIAYIGNLQITAQELLQYVNGPDFPTGGTVFYNSTLAASYLNGRGSCTIRGKTATEEHKGRQSIVVTEIPYTVNKASLVQKIAELVRDRKVQGISDLRDESGKEGIRIVIELKRDANPDAILNTLYKHTQLQITIPVMNVAVIKNNLVTLNLIQMIKIFIDHRIEVIKNRTQYDLSVASDRLHIVEGLLIAISNIDEVVAAIKKSADSKEARTGLMERYGMTEKQANAVLDMKLSKLTGLEGAALQGERSDLEASIKDYNDILANESRILQIIKDETKELKEKYGRDRRTFIDKETSIGEIESEDLIVDEDTTVILTKNNYMKRMPSSVYKSQGRGGRGVIAIELREGDFVKQISYCKSKDYLLVLTSKGRAYWLKAYQVPEANRYSIGKAAVNLVKLSEGESVELMVNTREFTSRFLTFITKRGTIKRVRAESFSKPRSSGILAIPLNQGDSLADACVSDGKANLFIATKKGKALRFNESDIRPMGRNAHGVRGIRLSQGDEVVKLLQAGESDLITTITENGFGKVTKLDEYRLQRRGGKGVINLKAKEKTGSIVKSLKTPEISSILLISSKGISIQFPVSAIRVTGRSASGVRLMRLDRGSAVVDAQVI
jgi:DNA gyrase subunit A